MPNQKFQTPTVLNYCAIGIWRLVAEYCDFRMALKFVSFFCLICLSSAMIQAAPTPPVSSPKVMVIPFVKEGQALRQVYESDEMLHLRVAVLKAKEALDQEGIPTIDFRAKLKQLSMDAQMTSTQQRSIKQRVIELSGAEVYVEIEAAVREDADGSSVTVSATAYDAFSGQSLANNVGTTKKYYTYNYERLAQKAISFFIKDFTTKLQAQFEKILTEGRSIVLEIGFDENAETDLDTELTNGQLLAESLEAWVSQNAFEGKYHVQGVTATKMIFDEIRTPVRNISGRPYRISKFAAQLRNFLKKQGLEVSRDIVGTKIYITVY